MTDSQDYATLAERLRQAKTVFSHGIRTADVGTCKVCGGYTSSGMNKLCHSCAISVIETAAEIFGNLSEVVHIQDAARYRYIRDHIFKYEKRGDLPEPLYSYFHEVVDAKYPTPEQFDHAIDYFMEQETHSQQTIDMDTDIEFYYKRKEPRGEQ